MLISTKGRYALTIMEELAQFEKDCYMPLPMIAEKQGISEKYLESIISMLVKGELVETLRGKKGGYRLKRQPDAYSIGEILRVAEGSLAPVSCLEGEMTCPHADGCSSLPVWQELEKIINEYLDSVTLKNLIEQGGSVRRDR